MLGSPKPADLNADELTKRRESLELAVKFFAGIGAAALVITILVTVTTGWGGLLSGGAALVVAIFFWFASKSELNAVDAERASRGM